MDISVLIGSCDEYNPLWKNFDILFKRYWEIPTKNYFVTETLEFKNENYISILAGKVKLASIGIFFHADISPINIPIAFIIPSVGLFFPVAKQQKVRLAKPEFLPQRCCPFSDHSKH